MKILLLILIFLSISLPKAQSAILTCELTFADVSYVNIGAHRSGVIVQTLAEKYECSSFANSAEYNPIHPSTQQMDVNLVLNQLDRLPVEFIKKIGLKRIVLLGPYSSIKDPSGRLVPAMAITFPLYGEIYISGPIISEVIMHEIAHNVDFVLGTGQNFLLYPESISNNTEIFTREGVVSDYVTNYASTSPGEDFAEIFDHLMNKGRNHPNPTIQKKFDFVRSRAESIDPQIASCWFGR